jgi:hypothetical protein
LLGFCLVFAWFLLGKPRPLDSPKFGHCADLGRVTRANQ